MQKLRLARNTQYLIPNPYPPAFAKATAGEAISKYLNI